MRSVALLVLTVTLVAAMAAPAAAVNLPPDFGVFTVGDTTSFDKPVALAFAADGRIFVSEQRGRIYVLLPDSNAADPRTGYVKQEPPFLAIEDEVLFNWDRGLLGLALDPDFENNGWVYFAYMVETYVEAGESFPDYIQDSYTRVERVQGSVANENVADESTRQVLIGATWETGIPSTHNSHTTGTLVFGDDGSLLISHGDGAHWDFIDSGGNDPESFLPGRVSADQDVGAFRAPYIDSMAGKILRIDPDTGDGLPSNPWYDPLAPDSPRSRVWAKGLRNPYRMDLKRGSGSADPADGQPGLLAVSEVGLNNWEELNLARGGEDFGWPCYEGPGPQPDYQLESPAHSGCTGDDSYVTWPIETWPHGGSVSTPFPGLTGLAAVGATFQSGPGWPTTYRNRLYFTDYVGRWIYAVQLDENDQPVDFIPFATDTATPVELRFDPYSRDLFSIDFTNGQILRYAYTGPTGLGEDPGAPTGLVAEPGSGQAVLSWNYNPEVDVVGYHVYRAADPAGPYTQITAQVVETNSFTDTGLVNGTPYWYRIVAVDSELPPRTSLPSVSVPLIPTSKTWEWYVPHPGPTLDQLDPPAPFPKRLTIPDPNASPNYDLWTDADRAPQLRKTALPDQDFVLETTISLQAFVAGEFFQTGIVVGFAANDAMLFGPLRGTDLALERTGVGTIQSFANAATTLDLRVVRTGNDLSFECRVQPTDPWTVVSVYNTASVPIFAGVVAKTWSSTVGLQVDILRLGLDELDPVAAATADILTGPAPLDVQFGSNSFDPDGDLILHHWDFGDGASSTASAPAHSFTDPGSYEVILDVTDGSGFTASDTLSVFVEGNQAPSAQITAPADGFEFIDGAAPIALVGSASDPDDVVDSLTFAWSVDLWSGGVLSPGHLTPVPGASSSFVPDVADTGQGVSWDVVLTVTDPDGASASDTVRVIDATLPPPAQLDLRASLADGAGPPVVPSDASPWVNLGLAGAAGDGTLQNFGGTGWAGTGGVGDPWRLEFDGVDDIVTVAAGAIAGLDQAASAEMWVRMPDDVQRRSYLLEWVESTTPPFPGLSLAVENGKLRIFLGSWVNLAPVEPSRWTRIVVVKEPGQWMVELDGAVVGQGSTPNLGAQTSELVIGASTFAGAGVYSDHARCAVAELRVYDRALSDANLTVMGAVDASPWADAPRLDAVDPTIADNAGPVELTLSGLDFVDGARVQLIRADLDTLEVDPAGYVSSTQLTATFDFTGLEAGARDLRVINPDGQSSLLAGALTVNAPSPALAAFLAGAADGSSPPVAGTALGPWRSTLGPDSLDLVGFGPGSGWAGDGSVADPWRLGLDGIDDELHLGGPVADSLVVNGQFSAELWIQVDLADSTGSVLAWTAPEGSFELRLQRTGLELFRPAIGQETLGDLPRDRWTHLVFTTDADTTLLWIDGMPAGGAPGMDLQATPPELSFGVQLWCDLAEVKLANVTMSPVQISAAYATGAPQFPAAEAARLTLLGSTQFIADGDSVTIDLEYDDLGYGFGLRGISASLLYDPNLIGFVDASEGELLPGSGDTFFVTDSSTPGVVTLDATLLGQVTGATGAGALAHFRFAEIVVPQDSTTTVTLVLSELIDAQDPPQPIPVLRIKTFEIDIHGGTIVTAPEAQSLTRLLAAAPNPFNPRTQIAFDLGRGGRTRLVVYDLAGRLVRVLVDQTLAAGRHAVIWDGVDASGRRVASGVYLYALRPEDGAEQVRKMTLLK